MGKDEEERWAGKGGFAMEGSPHQVVTRAVAAVLSRSGKTWLVGSSAYNMIENHEMHGDLDFVTTSRGVVVSLPHKTHPGVLCDIHTATLCMGGIDVDISTLDGLDFEEDMANRSCATSALAISSEGNHRVARHSSIRRIVPEGTDARVWVRSMVCAKGGERLSRFWQKKLSSGFVWGESF